MPAKKLTFKQKEFIKQYIALNGNGTQAALRSYDTTDYDTAHAISTENLQKPSIKEKIDEICQNLGFTINDAMAEVINGIKSGPEDKYKYLSLYFEVTGNKAPQRKEVDHNSHIFISQQQKDAINRQIRLSLTNNLSSLHTD